MSNTTATYLQASNQAKKYDHSPKLMQLIAKTNEDWVRKMNVTTRQPMQTESVDQSEAKAWWK
jgi:hypothetical protein